MSAAFAANAQYVRLQSAAGAPVPLQGVSAKGRLEGLLFELSIEQRYHNAGEENIEAVFTFPLPTHAELLGLELEIGERKLAAVAVERVEASRRYEEAIDKGDTAVLLEHNGDGLYTVNLGNLMAGEHAVIRYRYGQLLASHRGFVRLNIPTVIAPRYGNPVDAGLGGAAIPGADLLAAYPFDISLELTGLADDSAVHSPSHHIKTEACEGGLKVGLSGKGFLDRDFVLEIPQARLPTTALVARDGDAYVALASATMEEGTDEQRPVALKILVDCSGSMQGDSIAAARRALLAILDRLGPADQVSITRFGSRVADLTEGLEPADVETLPLMKALVREIQADLGGTEMAGALQHVLSQPTAEGQTADVILITDGQIYAVTSVVEMVARSRRRHRLSAVAIGTAPNEGLARSLAEKTGGSCEFVTAGEDAEPAIVRTFKRLRSTPRVLTNLTWPTTPQWIGPLPTAVFPGDTLHLFAGFDSQPSGRISMQAVEIDMAAAHMVVKLSEGLSRSDLIPRLAAAARIKALPVSEGRAMAVRYQLVTAYTSMVIVAQRSDGEKVKALPVIIPVPHMLAAGWAASGSVDRQAAVPAMIPRMADRRMLDPSPIMKCMQSLEPDFDTLDTAILGKAERERLVASLEDVRRRGDQLPTTLNELSADHKVGKDAIDALSALVVEGVGSEEEIVAIFLSVLLSLSEYATRYLELKADLVVPAIHRKGTYLPLQVKMLDRIFT